MTKYFVMNNFMKKNITTPPINMIITPKYFSGVHDAHRIEFRGESLRKMRGRQKNMEIMN